MPTNMEHIFVPCVIIVHIYFVNDNQMTLTIKEGQRSFYWLRKK